MNLNLKLKADKVRDILAILIITLLIIFLSTITL